MWEPAAVWLVVQLVQLVRSLVQTFWCLVVGRLLLVLLLVLLLLVLVVEGKVRPD